MHRKTQGADARSYIGRKHAEKIYSHNSVTSKRLQFGEKKPIDRFDAGYEAPGSTQYFMKKRKQVRGRMRKKVGVVTSCTLNPEKMIECNEHLVK